MKKNLASVLAVLAAVSIFSVKESAQAFKFCPWKKAPVKVEEPAPAVVTPAVTPVAAPVIAPAATPVVKTEVKKPCPVKSNCVQCKKPVPCAKKATPCAKKPMPCAKKTVKK